MARVPFIDPENVGGPLGATLRARPPLNLYRVLPHAPEVAEGFLALGMAILRRASLDPAIRELVILRVGALQNAAYEVHQHRKVAQGVGVPAAKIDAAASDGPAAEGVFDDTERTVLAFTDAVVREVKAPAPLYAAVARLLGPQQQLELLTTIGFYLLVGRVLENLEVEVESDGPEVIHVPPAPSVEAPAASPTSSGEDEAAQRQLFAPALGQARAGERMAGRRILVVGGGQRSTVDAEPPVGNGRAISLLLAREGAHVACADLRLELAEATAALARDEGNRAFSLQADVADPRQIERMVHEARERLGGLDGVVLNVGIGNTSRFGTETAEAWDAVMHVNLRAHMLAAQAACGVMDEGGSLVFISSTASISPLSGIPAYEASKAALAAVCRSTAYAGQTRGIRANVLAPGLIDTPLGRDASRNRPARSARPVPFGRQGTGWEVAHATLFLLSSESSYVNGQTLIADGGLSIGAVRAP